MSDRDESDSLRQISSHLLNCARESLGLSCRELRRLISAPTCDRPADRDGAYRALASLADDVMRRSPLADGVVDGFYTNALQGNPGEAMFAGGARAMLMHGYPESVVCRLPAEVRDRFLGIANVWRGVDPPLGQRVIDVGCGCGADLGVATSLAANNALLVGIDKRPELLKVASRAFRFASFVVGDLAAPPVVEQSFDLVLANGLPPLQRPITLSAAAFRLLSLAAPTGTVSATVIVASPTLESSLAEIAPHHDADFARGLARLISGKPATDDVRTAFSRFGARVTVHEGANPYRQLDARSRSAVITVNASKQ